MGSYLGAVSHDCPYCGARGASFSFRAEVRALEEVPKWWHLGECGVCHEFALIKLEAKNFGEHSRPSEVAQGMEIKRLFHLASFVPQPARARIPDHIPDNVSRSFTEAEQCYIGQQYSGAASCYRKAIERAVRILAPQEKGTLNARIRRMEEQGLIPQALIDLLDQVRVLGNFAVHEDDEDPTKDDCTAARDFANLFLLYTFSLPQRVKLAQQRAANP